MEPFLFRLKKMTAMSIKLYKPLRCEKLFMDELKQIASQIVLQWEITLPCDVDKKNAQLNLKTL